MLTKKALEETSKVLGEAMHGDFVARGRLKAIVDQGYVLNESISSSDLAQTFAYTTAAALQSQYAAITPTWTQFAKRDVFEDFKPKQHRELIFNEDIDLAENGGHITAPGSLPAVPEGTEYPTFQWTTSAKQLSLHKKGARIGFTWESVINDEWGFIQSLPGQMVIYARNTEEPPPPARTPTPSTLATATLWAPRSSPSTVSRLRRRKSATARSTASTSQCRSSHSLFRPRWPTKLKSF
jgi:hypothetical protein